MSVVRMITERVASPFTGCRVDLEAGVIYGVKLGGFVSENGRDYATDVYRRRIGRYDGATINFNHATERTVEYVGGKVRNPRVDEAGVPRGDAHLLKTHPYFGPVMEAAQLEASGQGGGLYGFSHVILAKTTRGRNGRDLVEDIEAVESVDIVATPATTKGFFESRRTAVPTTLRKVIESTLARLAPERQKPARKLLVEMDDGGAMGAVADAPVEEPAAESDPDTAIDDAFKQAMHAQIDALLDGSHTLAELLSKIRELGKAHAKVTGKGGGDEKGAEETPAEESRKNDAARLTREAIDVCRKVGFKGFDADDLDAIASVPAARRESLARRLMGPPAAGGGEAPESGSRHQTDRFAEEADARKRVNESRQGKGDTAPAAASLTDGPLGWNLN